MSRIRWVVTAVMLGALLGCGNQDIGELYRAERDFHRARREAKRLEINPEIVEKEDRLQVATRFQAVGDTYFKPIPTVEDTLNLSREGRRVILIGARAYLLAGELYMKADDFDAALSLSQRVRDELAWSVGETRVAQQRVVDATFAKREMDAAVRELWRLSEGWPVASEDGSTVYNRVLNAPMSVVDLTLAQGDSAALDAVVARAIRFYADVREKWPGQTPAMLADMHRSNLLDKRGEWREAVVVLDGVLEDYPEDVLAAREATQVAYTAGRILMADNRDLAGAEVRFQRVREGGLSSNAARDASLAMALMAAQAGRFPEAVAIYRELEQEAPEDMDRVPIAKMNVARIFESEGRWEEAQSEYRSLRASYPRSPQALEAPLAIADHYRTENQTEVMLSVLRQAEDEYREMMEERPGTQEAFLAHRNLIRAVVLQDDWPRAVDVMIDFAHSYEGSGEAAMALLEAARLSRDKLEDSARCDELLEQVEQTYPNTPYAELATGLRAKS